MNQTNGEASFEWDPGKSHRNEVKHGVTFDEAASVFYDYLSRTIADEQHSTLEEPRFVTIGKSATGRTLVVVHCDRAERIRIISAREANRLEKREYKEGRGARRNQ